MASGLQTGQAHHAGSAERTHGGECVAALGLNIGYGRGVVGVIGRGRGVVVEYAVARCHKETVAARVELARNGGGYDHACGSGAALGQGVKFHTIVVGNAEVGYVDKASAKVASHAQALVALALHVGCKVNALSVGIDAVDALQLANTCPRVTIVGALDTEG